MGHIKFLSLTKHVDFVRVPVEVTVFRSWSISDVTVRGAPKESSIVLLWNLIGSINNGEKFTISSLIFDQVRLTNHNNAVVSTESPPRDIPRRFPDICSTGQEYFIVFLCLCCWYKRASQRLFCCLFSMFWKKSKVWLLYSCRCANYKNWNLGEWHKNREENGSIFDINRYNYIFASLVKLAVWFWKEDIYLTFFLFRDYLIIEKPRFHKKESLPTPPPTSKFVLCLNQGITKFLLVMYTYYKWPTGLNERSHGYETYRLCLS